MKNTVNTTTADRSSNPATDLTTGTLELRSVSKLYDLSKPDEKAVSNANLEIPAGSLISLLGPSGCGKTTTLRMIAGFEEVTEGDILLDGKSLLNTPPEKRPMSMVFQSYALFPHLTVENNVAFGLKLKKMPRADRNARVREALELIGIEKHAKRYPHQLSGGQQQRVALARALVMEPKIVLFDEPLSNLDAELRVRMREEIRAVQQRLGLTSVFVTHDQSEALSISDHLAVMRDGYIEQVGTPEEVYRFPANEFVATFIGESNLVPGTITKVVEAGMYEIDTAFGLLTTPGVAGLTTGTKVSVVLRTEDLHIAADANDVPVGAKTYPAVVQSANFDGNAVNYRIEIGEKLLRARTSNAGSIIPGQTEAHAWLNISGLWAVEGTVDKK